MTLDLYSRVTADMRRHAAPALDATVLKAEQGTA
jgi:hypothetical protein